jgi:hypothetical protein
MNLKLKAKIYQYTGIYLAQKEEQEFINTSYENMGKHPTGLLVGLWQANCGFTSHSSDFRFKARKNILYRVLHRLVIIYKQLKQDLGL